jgi:hypothetical protein
VCSHLRRVYHHTRKQAFPLRKGDGIIAVFIYCLPKAGRMLNRIFCNRGADGRVGKEFACKMHDGFDGISWRTDLIRSAEADLNTHG